MFSLDSHVDNSFVDTEATVPTVLLEKNRWVNWKYDDNGKKPPVDGQTGRPISAKDPDNYRSFEIASRSKYNLGFVLSADDIIACIDIDDLERDHPFVQELIESCDTYVVWSPSGDGLHMWVLAKETENFTISVDGGKIEFFTSDRYMTFTGDIAGKFTEIGNGQPAVEKLLEERPEPVENDHKPPANFTGDTEQRLQYAIGKNANLKTLVEWSRNETSLSDTGFAEDRSAAECAITTHLAFWFDGDYRKVMSVMETLAPPKWAEEGDGYKDSVVNSGIETQTETADYTGESKPSQELTSGVFCDLIAEPMTTKEVAESVNYSQKQTRKALNYLKDANVVGYREVGRSGKWFVINPDPDIFDSIDNDLNPFIERDRFLREQNLKLHGKDSRDYLDE